MAGNREIRPRGTATVVSRGVRHKLVAILGVLAGLVAFAAVAVWVGLGVAVEGGAGATVQAAVAIVALGAGLAVWRVFVLVDRHFQELDRVRGAVVTLTGNQSAVLPLREPGEMGPEIELLYAALGDYAARYAEERADPDRRLSAILASVSEALLVITEQGQVSLVNYLAKSLLGAERVRVGTSVFAALERDPVVQAIARAEREGQPVTASVATVDGDTLPVRVVRLAEHGGAVLSFAPGAAEHRAEVEHDLALHDRPPAIVPLGDDTPLSELHMTVLDTETTGLDPAVDRVISIGGVRAYGARIYRRLGFDRLVNPGVPIPARSTAVHGITDAMIADAQAFAAVYGDFAALSHGTVWVGHNVAFDVAMLRRECARAGLAWQEPITLDTLLLADSLKLALPGLSLDQLAEHFLVDVHGRHTALGDSLVTAEIFMRMLPLLLDAGIATLGQATAFANRARHHIARQKEAGWHEET